MFYGRSGRVADEVSLRCPVPTDSHNDHFSANLPCVTPSYSHRDHPVVEKLYVKWSRKRGQMEGRE